MTIQEIDHELWKHTLNTRIRLAFFPAYASIILSGLETRMLFLLDRMQRTYGELIKD